MSIEAVAAWALHLDEGQVENFRVTWWLSCCQELLAWHKGAVLTGLSVKQKEDHWLLVVHVVSKFSGVPAKKQVTFVEADDMWTCFEIFARCLARNTLVWVDDKYPPT